MLAREQARAMREILESFTAPVLTLYVETHPAWPDPTPKALTLRAKAALAGLAVPPAVAAQALARLKEPAPGRTRVILAGEGFVHAWSLQAELPLVDTAEARWGEPRLSPLLYALDESERFGVVCLGPERARLFEVFWGEAEELPGAFGAFREGDRRRAGPDSAGRRMRPAGGVDGDRFGQRLAAWNGRFHKRLALELEEWVEVRGMTRLALLGNPREVEAFASVLPRPLHERVAVKLSGALPHLTPASLLKSVGPKIEAFERQWENDLVSDLLGRGVGGPDQVLRLLQEGRLRLVVAPWRLEQRALCLAGGSYALNGQTEARGGATGVPLKDVLPELASAWGTRLAFVRGEAEQRLLRGLGGLGGLERY